jgi:amino acid transporter
VSVVLCGLAWALALQLPFKQLISIDLILYGSSLLLEFVALVVLRLREPELERPFKAGNLAMACLLGVGPAALIGYALYASRDEKIIGTTSALLFALVVGLLGPVLYWLTAVPLARRRLASCAPSVGSQCPAMLREVTDEKCALKKTVDIHFAPRFNFQVDSSLFIHRTP